MTITIVLFCLIFGIFSCQSEKENESLEFTPEVITEYWTSGKTLPLKVSEKYPFDLQEIENDNGYNVLIDLAHQCSFKSLWGFAPRLNSLGYRALTSHASIHSLLDPDGLSRARIMYDKENKIYPFAWIPNPKINVIITEQSDPNAQDYCLLYIPQIRLSFFLLQVYFLNIYLRSLNVFSQRLLIDRYNFLGYLFTS